MDPDEVDHVMRELFGGKDGAHEIDRLDHNIAKLPGMDGLRIFHNATAHARESYRAEAVSA